MRPLGRWWNGFIGGTVRMARRRFSNSGDVIYSAVEGNSQVLRLAIRFPVGQSRYSGL
ncbi:protein of unknown function [Candidatus Filomicrobium marinum]|nr:protein of unknown function [Candidatus Filomicrobium marinum]